MFANKSCSASGIATSFTHVFDMVVTMTNGTRTAYTVKPEVRLVSGRFLDEMQTIAWWVRDSGFADMTRLLTEADLDPVAGHNASINAALRDVDAEAEDAARNMARTLRGVASIRDLTGRLGLERERYCALLRTDPARRAWPRLPRASSVLIKRFLGSICDQL